MNIHAIETTYNGYRFRSRLEARWAVFFDAIGVKYLYEREGYNLGSLGLYLPDFWLPQFRYWIEVKGDNPTSLERQKLSSVCLHTRADGFIFSNDVYKSAATAAFKFVPREVYESKDRQRNRLRFPVVIEDITGIVEDWTSWYFMWFGAWLDESWFVELVPMESQAIADRELQSSTWEDLMNAYITARSARFEHGDSPRFV